MFIRRTQTRNTASGERYCTYRLVRSERAAGKVKQFTLLNLGRHFDVDQAHWPALCCRIEALLAGQATLLAQECPASVERHAQRSTAQLIAQRAPLSAAETAERAAAQPVQGADVQSVLVDSLELVRPRTVGVEAAALWAMAQVDFQGLLRALGFTGPQRAAALGSIIGRMAAPGSELATHAWLGERSGLGELLDVPAAGVPPHRRARREPPVHHRAGLPVRADHSPSAAGAEPGGQLAQSAPVAWRPGARDRGAPARRWTYAARA